MDMTDAIRYAHARLSVTSAAEESPSAPAFVYDAHSCSFADLVDAIAPTIGPLVERRHQEVRPIAARELGADAESVKFILACIEAGIPFSGMHPRWTPTEKAAAEAALGGPPLRRPLGDAHIAAEQSVAIALEDPCAVVFTSGTSGASRPMVLSRGAFVASALASESLVPVTLGDAWLLGLTPAHVGGISIITRCLLARATVVLDPGPFDAARWHALVARQGVTHASVVPTMLKRLVDLRAVSPTTLRHLLVGGAACDEVLAARARDLGYSVQRTYGMTETCAMIATEARAGVGGARIHPGVEARALDGVLGVRGPTLASGRWTESGIEPLPRDADGYFVTGDRGAIDANGRLSVHGRADSVIVTGGENVHPSEVEAALMAIDGVRAAVVFSQPDTEWGEVVCAAVDINTEDASTDIADIASVHASLGRLASFRRPRRYALVAPMPLLATGKVDRRATIAIAIPCLAEPVAQR